MVSQGCVCVRFRLSVLRASSFDDIFTCPTGFSCHPTQLTGFDPAYLSVTTYRSATCVVAAIFSCYTTSHTHSHILNTQPTDPCSEHDSLYRHRILHFSLKRGFWSAEIRSQRSSMWWRNRDVVCFLAIVPAGIIITRRDSS
jgi:hypothetical protein